MKCIVKSFEKKERENGELPYYVIKARGTQGDENADAFDDDGVVNFAAVQSRVFNFTKCLFPGTEAQCEALEKGFDVDDDFNVLNERAIYLMFYQWKTGKKFHIYNGSGEIISDTVTKEVEVIADRDKTINGKPVKRGQKYIDVIEEDVARVFEQISLVLLCDKAGNSVENGGEAPELIAQRNFESGLAKGTYELI